VLPAVRAQSEGGIGGDRRADERVNRREAPVTSAGASDFCDFSEAVNQSGTAADTRAAYRAGFITDESKVEKTFSRR